MDPASEKVIVGNIVSAARTTSGATWSSVRTATSTSPSATACARSAARALRRPQHQLTGPGGAARQDPARGRSGRPAATNPYAARRFAPVHGPAGIPAGSGPCKEIFAMGFRNPFRFARKPGHQHFSSTTSERRPGRGRRLGRARTTGGTSAKASAPEDPRRSAVGSRATPTRSTPTCTRTTAARSPGARSSPQGCGRGSTGPISSPTTPAAGSGGWTAVRRQFRRAPFSSGLPGPTQLRFGPAGDTRPCTTSASSTTRYAESQHDVNAGPPLPSTTCRTASRSRSRGCEQRRRQCGPGGLVGVGLRRRHTGRSRPTCPRRATPSPEQARTR